MKYKDWLKNWLENYVKVSSKHRTYMNYSECVANHIVPNLGDYELNDLTPFEMQRFVTKLTESGNLKTGSGLSSSTVNGIITIIKSSLETAYVVGELKEYPAHSIKRPKLDADEVRCFSVADQKKIESAILVMDNKKQRMFGVILCLYTGLRIGELLALEWDDVDLQHGTISITKTCYYGKNKQGVYCRIVDKPKTSSSKRIIPLPKQIVPLLKEQKKKSQSIYVISNGSKPVSIRSYQESFSNLLKRIGVPREGFHALRHTFATRAIECGMDVKSLSEILGHKNPTITLKKYVHSLMEHKKDMMDKIGKML